MKHFSVFLAALAGLMLCAVPARVQGRQQDQQQQQQQQQRQQKDQTVQGTVKQMGQVQPEGEEEAHLILTLASDDGTVYLIDLGPADEAEQIADGIDRGDRVSVSGQRDWAGDQPVIRADQLRTDEGQYTLRSSWGDQQEQQQQQQPQRQARRGQQQQQQQQRYDREQDFDAQQAARGSSSRRRKASSSSTSE